MRSPWNLIMCLRGRKPVLEFSSLSLPLKLFRAPDLSTDSDCDNDDSTLSKELSFDVPS